MRPSYPDGSALNSPGALLRRPAQEQLVQRVGMDYHLAALAEETQVYIAHRLAMAGREAPGLFTVAACEAVHRQRE